MEQISIYRHGVKFANVPVPRAGAIYMMNVTQVPSFVMASVRNWARGIGLEQRYGEWSWEWQQQGAPIAIVP